MKMVMVVMMMMMKTKAKFDPAPFFLSYSLIFPYVDLHPGFLLTQKQACYVCKTDKCPKLSVLSPLPMSNIEYTSKILRQEASILYVLFWTLTEELPTFSYSVS